MEPTGDEIQQIEEEWKQEQKKFEQELENPGQDAQEYKFEAESNQQGSWILLSDPIKKSGHIEYTVEGEDKNGKINLTKRYSDFDHLRQALLIRWPGIYIPPLPEKKALGNKQDQFIMERLHFMQRFVTGLVQNSHLLYSLEVRNFFHSFGSLDKSSFNAESMQNLKAKYCEAFKVDMDTIQQQVLKFQDEKIKKFSAKLKEILPIINQIKQKCKSGILARKQVIHSTSKQDLKKQEDLYVIDKTMNAFKQFQDDFLKEMVDHDQDLFVIKSDDTFQQKIKTLHSQQKNPYNLIYLWVKAEYLQMIAFQEAVAKRDHIDTDYKKLQKKKQDLMVKLNKIDATKSSVQQLAQSAKPGSKFDKLKAMMDEEENMDVILRITCKHLSHFINQHKELKTKEYYQMVKDIGASEELTSNMVRYLQIQNMLIQTINLWVSVFNACKIDFDTLQNF